MSAPLRFFLSTGEASGDAYAAALIDSLRTRLEGREAIFEGIGGRKCQAAGMRLIADSSGWGAISIVQALLVVPRLWSGYYRTKRAVGRGLPGLFIPIDFGYLNIRLARHAKNRGWKILYFVPPGSWKRDRQGKDLPALADAISTPFSWSAEILNRLGAKAFWFGHPIRQLVEERRKTIPPLDERLSVAVLPGSRKHEIAANLPVLAEAVKGLEFSLEFAVATNIGVEALSSIWQELTGRSDAFTVGDTAGVLLRARAAFVCSGTATLEAALCRCPMVVFYQLTKAMVREVKLIRMKRPKYIALPNILLDRLAVPEHVEEHGVSPQLIRRELEVLLEDSPERAEQLKSFAELEDLLGPSDSIDRTADLALQVYNKAAKLE